MRTIENPVSGEKFTFLDSDPQAAAAAGGRLRLEVIAAAGAASPPRHIHRREEERFEILDGEVTVLVGRDTRLLRPGDTCQVPPGYAHTWHNSGGRPARMVVEFTPAGASRSFFETFCGLAGEGRCDERGQPPLLQVAASMPLWQMYLASPPIAVQQLTMAVLRPLARIRGYRASYPRFEAPLPDGACSSDLLSGAPVRVSTFGEDKAAITGTGNRTSGPVLLSGSPRLVQPRRNVPALAGIRDAYPAQQLYLRMLP